VRFNGIIHDFMMLNPLRETAATTSAVEQAIQMLSKALRTNKTRDGFNGRSHEHAAVSLVDSPTL
jgi:hypothetical protein